MEKVIRNLQSLSQLSLLSTKMSDEKYFKCLKSLQYFQTVRELEFQIPVASRPTNKSISDICVDVLKHLPLLEQFWYVIYLQNFSRKQLPISMGFFFY